MYESMEGEKLSIGATLTCGNVGVFTVSLNFATNDTRDKATAKGTNKLL